MNITKAYENRQRGFTDRYVFKFSESGGHYVIYCVHYPRDPFDRGPEHHHMFEGGRLCQREGYESRTFEHAQAFAQWWLKRWSIYIRTGHFSMTSESMYVHNP